VKKLQGKQTKHNKNIEDWKSTIDQVYPNCTYKKLPTHAEHLPRQTNNILG
jgi:hypothetical protein